MIVSKLKVSVAVVLAVGMMGTGVGWVVWPGAGPGPVFAQGSQRPPARVTASDDDQASAAVQSRRDQDVDAKKKLLDNLPKELQDYYTRRNVDVKGKVWWINAGTGEHFAFSVVDESVSPPVYKYYVLDLRDGASQTMRTAIYAALDKQIPIEVSVQPGQPNVASAAKQALTSGGVVTVDAIGASQLFGAVPLDGYSGETKGVIIAAVPASLVDSLGGLLWPVFAVAGLGVLLVLVGGVLLGNYISGPISELEDGLLAIINGNSDLRFQLEHEELGGLVFRINSLLNALMGVAEDTTDEQGRPSQGPSARDFQEALAVDESSVAGNVDPGVSAALGAEGADQYYRRLYNEYIAAKRQIGEPVEHITFEAFVGRIRTSEAETSQKHGKPVRYQVQLRGNAVVLIAVPLS